MSLSFWKKKKMRKIALRVQENLEIIRREVPLFKLKEKM